MYAYYNTQSNCTEIICVQLLLYMCIMFKEGGKVLCATYIMYFFASISFFSVE